MSGGSMGYLYEKLERLAGELETTPFTGTTPNRNSVAERLYDLEIVLRNTAKALKAIEWCNDGDIGPEKEDKILTEFLSK